MTTLLPLPKIPIYLQYKYIQTHSVRGNLANMMRGDKQRIAKSSVAEGSRMQELHGYGGRVTQRQIRLDALYIVAHLPWFECWLRCHTTQNLQSRVSIVI